MPPLVPLLEGRPLGIRCRLPSPLDSGVPPCARGISSHIPNTHAALTKYLTSPQGCVVTYRLYQSTLVRLLYNRTSGPTGRTVRKSACLPTKCPTTVTCDTPKHLARIHGRVSVGAGVQDNT